MPNQSSNAAGWFVAPAWEPGYFQQLVGYAAECRYDQERSLRQPVADDLDQSTNRGGILDRRSAELANDHEWFIARGLRPGAAPLFVARRRRHRESCCGSRARAEDRGAGIAALGRRLRTSRFPARDRAASGDDREGDRQLPATPETTAVLGPSLVHGSPAIPPLPVRAWRGVRVPPRLSPDARRRSRPGCSAR